MTAIKTTNRTKTDSRADEQVMKVGFAVIGLTSCAIGVWSVASLIGGVVASGGPVALIGNWFKAVIG
ncbi:MAG: hypothetical protein GY702_18055 [Desulfobulbaceae bacterium]|nr:hypothetical protein [Desulfobulbaceae bacterium]